MVFVFFQWILVCFSGDFDFLLYLKAFGGYFV